VCHGVECDLPGIGGVFQQPANGTAVGFIIFVVVWLVRGVSGESRNQGGKNALEILDERLARGEIGREEYEMKRKSLS